MGNLNGGVIHPYYYYDDTTGDVYALEIKEYIPIHSKASLYIGYNMQIENY